MSLSTLLEAAKYLDYLDSSNNNQPQNQQLQYQSPQPKLTRKKSVRRPRATKKNGMVAMSLPSSGLSETKGVPIPMVSGESHQAASLSSSYTTGSPLSSFASTALLCSKASGVTSNSSSAASSFSSSDSSSSCGDILMGENDFTTHFTPNSSGGTTSKNNKKTSYINHNNNNISIYNNNNSNNHHNYHLTHQSFEASHSVGGQQVSMPQLISGSNNRSVARYIAATSAGPQLVTMTGSTAVASASAPIEGSLRAGRVIQAANLNTNSNQFPLTTQGIQHHQNHPRHHQTQTPSGLELNSSSFMGDNNLNGSAASCPPLIMARVQPMILNSLAPNAQSIMAFQQATASSPTSSSSSYSRHRELHKTLEKNRRAHLRHCFELLKAELPASECVDKKTSHINIIKSAIRHVLALREQEANLDNEQQRLTKIKNKLTESLSKLRGNQQQQQSKEPEHELLEQERSLRAKIKQEHEELEQQQQHQQQHQHQHQHQHQQSQQQPVAEQQLSFLLSQSKID